MPSPFASALPTAQLLGLDGGDVLLPLLLLRARSPFPSSLLTLRSYSVWMVAADACALTCGRCTPCACTCTDVPPDGQYTCAQQARLLAA